MIYSPKYTWQIRCSKLWLPSESLRSSLIGKKIFPRFFFFFFFLFFYILPATANQFRSSPSPRLGCRKGGHFFFSFPFLFRNFIDRRNRAKGRGGEVEVSPDMISTIYFRIERESGSLLPPPLPAYEVTERKSRVGGDSARGNQFLGFRRPSRKKEEEEEQEKEKGKKGSAIWKSRGQWTLSGPVEGEIDLENHLVVRSWAREGARRRDAIPRPRIPLYTSRACNEIPRQIKVEDGRATATLDSRHASRSFYLCRTRRRYAPDFEL